jgi:hypothetical protein
MIDTTKWPEEARAEHDRLCLLIDKLRGLAQHMKDREQDICAAVGGVADGGQYRNDIIDHLKVVMARAASTENFTPTPANINALPAPLRHYIRDLETRCDPAGDVQTMAALKQNVAGLEALLVAYREVRAVLIEAAPVVAVFARNVLVSPETRDMLLKLEPRMLKALLDTKET